MNKRFSSLMIVAVFVFIFAANANAENFFAYLEGRQENPGVATSATGYARVFLNESTMMISYRVVYNNLSSNQTAGHIHTAPLGVAGGVTIGFSTVPGGTSGGSAGEILSTGIPLARTSVAWCVAGNHALAKF